MRSVYSWAYATTALTAILTSATALAQDAPAARVSDSQADDIIVTAQKRAQSINDVAMTLNVVGANEVQDRGVTAIVDLAKVVPGLTVVEYGNGLPIYTVRGISFNALNYAISPAVVVSTDEASLPFSVMAQGGLFDLERVELLKGPQGTLYGQNATGGAINFIANKPTDSLHYGGEVSYGRFDTLQAQGYVSGPISDTLKARLAVSATNSGPWQYSASRPDDRLGDKRKFAGRLLLDWQPTEKLKIGINLNGWVDNSDTQAAQLVAYRIQNPPGVDPRTASQPITIGSPRKANWLAEWPNRRHDRFYQAVLRADYDLTPDLQLTSLSNYTHLKFHAFYGDSGYAIPIQDHVKEGYIKAFNQELRLSGDIPDAGIHFILGGNYQKDNSYEDQFWQDTVNSAIHNLVLNGTRYDFDAIQVVGRQWNKSIGVFGNVDWDATDQLTVSGGLRYTEVKHFNRGCTRDDGTGAGSAFWTALGNIFRGASGLPPMAAIPAGGCITLGPDFTPFDQDQSFKEHNVAWRTNLNYKITPQVSVFATVSRGYKAGAYNVQPAFNYLTLQPITQEQLTNYEAGFKAQLFDRALMLNAAVFYYDYKDKQLLTSIRDPLIGLLFVNRNIPKAKVTGFELEAAVRPVSGLTLRSAVTYANTKSGAYPDNDLDLNPVNDKGHQFNLAPKWTSVSDVEYRHEFSGGVEGYVGGSLTYNSSSYSDLASSDLLKINSYTTLDLRAGVEFPGGFEAMVWGKNVTNTYYWNFALPSGEATTRYANMPATYGVTMRFKY